jgi:hypothetical protein
MILEKIVHFLRRMVTSTFITFLLLFGVVGSVAYGLSLMIRGLSLDALFFIALFGLTMGWGFARTRLSNWLAAVLLPLTGAILILFIGSELFTPTANLLRATVLVVWESGQAYFVENQAWVTDLTSVQLALSEININLNATWIELTEWIVSLSSGTPVFSSTGVYLSWGFFIWIIAIWAGWVHRRYKKVILSILPGCILLIVTLGFTYGNTAALFPLLAFALPLLALTWLDGNETRWKKAQIDYPDDVRTDTILAFVGITIVLITLAFVVPRISIRKMVEIVREWTNPQVEQAAPFMESIGIEPNKPSIGRFGSLLNAGLPRSHLIGAGPELSEEIVMSVQITAGLPPGVEAPDEVPLYWRGLTYDQYTGQGWDSSDVALRSYSADQQIGVFERPGYWIIEQEIRFLDESELLFVAGDLISVDENYRVAWRSEPWLSDIQQFPGDFFGATTNEITYRAQSFVPVVDENALRDTGWIYPDWIRENYVLVPINTPQRVINFTRTLIEDMDNPYDRALTIEQYLRQYEYTTDLPSPPPDWDIVDYFLFDLRKGYCDYYASAMVVMARAADLPARLVVGYAPGTYDPANNRYVITEANAHSWAEIYFQGVGWVPFEPTAGLKEIARSETPLEFPGDSTYVIETESLMGGIKPLFGSWLLTFGILIAGVVWAIMVWVTLDEWMLKRLSPEKMVERLYWRLYRHGRRIGIPAQREDTPNNFATKLNRRFTLYFTKVSKRRSLRQVRRDISTMTDLFAQAQFSQVGLVDSDQQKLMGIWQRLRRPLFFARIVYWFNRLKPKGATMKDESQS